MTASISAAVPPTTVAAAQPSVFGNGGDFSMFLRLLTTQMQNQDPLNPMDSTQYTQQLAQYSQVEQSIQQTGLLKDLLATLSERDLAQAAGLIGKKVEFAGDAAALTDSGAHWTWTPSGKVDSIRAEIVDASGVVVARPSLRASDGVLTWDGTMTSGGKAPSGIYTLKLDARDAAGAAVQTSITSGGTVTQVLSTVSGMEPTIGSQAIPLSKVLGVRAG